MTGHVTLSHIISKRAITTPVDMSSYLHEEHSIFRARIGILTIGLWLFSIMSVSPYWFSLDKPRWTVWSLYGSRWNIIPAQRVGPDFSFCLYNCNYMSTNEFTCLYFPIPTPLNCRDFMILDTKRLHDVFLCMYCIRRMLRRIVEMWQTSFHAFGLFPEQGLYGCTSTAMSTLLQQCDSL